MVGSCSNQPHLHFLIFYSLNEKQIWGWFVLKPITLVFPYFLFLKWKTNVVSSYLVLMWLVWVRTNHIISYEWIIKEIFKNECSENQAKTKIHILNSLFFSCLSVVIYCIANIYDTCTCYIYKRWHENVPTEMTSCQHCSYFYDICTICTYFYKCVPICRIKCT